jgi:SNF2 family DNA or RNA helicase
MVSVSVNPRNPRGFALTFPYEPALIDKVKLCLDTAWDKELKAWLSQGPEVLMDMRRFGIPIGWMSAEARMHAEAFHRELTQSYEARAMSFGTEKWDYQKPGSAWLNSMTAAILGDEMGVGKTKQTLDSAVEPGVLRLTNEALEANSRTVLILCNKTLTYKWLNEVNRWHPAWAAGVVPADKLTKNKRFPIDEEGHFELRPVQGRNDFWQERPQIVIAHYEQLLRDDWPWELDWDILICDEATRFKNKSTQLYKCIDSLSKIVISEDKWYTGTRHFWCLTGTPMEKAIYEFWNLFNLVRPGLLSNWWRFKEQHVETDDDGKVVGVKNLNLLHERVGYFMLRRTRKEVMPWLPEKLYNNALIEFNAGERAAYDTFKSTFHNWLTERGVSGSNNPMTQTLRMRQFCCSPWLFTPELGFGSKYEALYDILEDWGGHIVLFSYFREMTTLLQDWYDTNPRAYIDGNVAAEERFRRCEDFNAGRLGKIFISTDAGNAGVDLPIADLIIHYDQGNFNAVQVLNMLMLDSVDVGMYQLAREEEELSRQVVDGAEEFMIRRLTPSRWQQLIEGRLDGSDGGRNLAT